MMRFQPPKFDGKVNFSNAFSERRDYKITLYQESRTENAEYQYNKKMIMSGLMKSFIFIVGLIIFFGSFDYGFWTTQQ